MFNKQKLFEIRLVNYGELKETQSDLWRAILKDTNLMHSICSIFGMHPAIASQTELACIWFVFENTKIDELK